MRFEDILDLMYERRERIREINAQQRERLRWQLSFIMVVPEYFTGDDINVLKWRERDKSYYALLERAVSYKLVAVMDYADGSEVNTIDEKEFLKLAS